MSIPSNEVITAAWAAWAEWKHYPHNPDEGYPEDEEQAFKRIVRSAIEEAKSQMEWREPEQQQSSCKLSRAAQPQRSGFTPNEFHKTTSDPQPQPSELTIEEIAELRHSEPQENDAVGVVLRNICDYAHILPEYENEIRRQINIALAAERDKRKDSDAHFLDACKQLTAEREKVLRLEAYAIELDKAERAERSKLAAAVEALERAKTTIYALHGEIAWPQYQHSLEMKQINSALAKCQQKQSSGRIWPKGHEKPKPVKGEQRSELSISFTRSPEEQAEIESGVYAEPYCPPDPPRSEPQEWTRRLETVAYRLRQTQMGKEWTRRDADADIIENEVIPKINAAVAAEKVNYAAWRLKVNEEHRQQLAAETRRADDSIIENVRLMNKLATEREKYKKREIELLEDWSAAERDLMKQLAAEREKLELLEHAYDIRHTKNGWAVLMQFTNYEYDLYPTLREAIDATLAKMKEGKMSTPSKEAIAAANDKWNLI